MKFKTELSVDAIELAVKKAILAEHPFKDLNKKSVKVNMTFINKRKVGLTALIDIETTEKDM